VKKFLPLLMLLSSCATMNTFHTNETGLFPRIKEIVISQNDDRGYVRLGLQSYMDAPVTKRAEIINPLDESIYVVYSCKDNEANAGDWKMILPPHSYKYHFLQTDGFHMFDTFCYIKTWGQAE
jgi:hypothetical protein